MTNDITGPVIVPENVEAFIVDLTGDIEVRYTCTDLRAGFRYDEVFHVTVNGVEKCLTNAVPALDAGYASLAKAFVIRGEELFGAEVRDDRARVRVELVPIPPAD